MSKLKISIGTDNFRKLVTTTDILVDKSLFIKDIIDSNEEAILITRPRRWGKSLALSILKTFFEPESKKCRTDSGSGSWLPNFLRFTSNPEDIGSDVSKSICNKDIFSKLKIATVDSGKYMKYQGKYPVILVNFKDVTGQTVEEIKSSIALLMSELFQEHKYLIDFLDIISKDEALPLSTRTVAIENLAIFNKILQKQAAQDEMHNSLKFLSKLLYDYYQQKVYILVDEYDKPVNSLLEKRLSEDYDKIIKEISLEITTLLSTAGKTNDYLEKIILTGIFDTVKKEGGSGFTNLSVYGITAPEFSDSFGFTEKEVNEIVDCFSNVKHQMIKHNISQWYNGYTSPIDATPLYTPWAVMKYLNSINNNKGHAEPQSYWVASGASTMLQSLLEKDACVNSSFSNTLLNMTESGSITLLYDPAISLLKYDLATAPIDERVFSYLLLNTGYLNSIHRNDTHITLSIPNSEVRQEFVNVLRTHIRKVQQETPNVCTRIMDALHYKQHLLAVDKIRKGNVIEVEQFFSFRSNQPCYDKGISIHYQELALMFHNPDHELHMFLDKHCNISHSSYQNGENLKLVDYQFMFHPENRNVSELSIAKPGFVKSIVCYQHVIPGMSAIIGGVLGKFVEKIFPTKEWVPTILGSVLGYGVQECVTTEYFCESYNKYSEIDISKPDELRTFTQFEKYILEHLGTFLTTGECGESGQITSITISLFPSFIPGNELHLSLCGAVEDTSEL